MTLSELGNVVRLHLNDITATVFPQDYLRSYLIEAYRFLQFKTGLHICIPIYDSDVVPGAETTAAFLAAAFVCSGMNCLESARHFYTCAGYPMPVRTEVITYVSTDEPSVDHSTNLPQ